MLDKGGGGWGEREWGWVIPMPFSKVLGEDSKARM